MKTRFNRQMIVAALAISSLALLTGCGAAGSGTPGAPAAPGAVGIGGGCVPINTTTMIGFTATSMYMGNPQTGDMRVLGGIIPPGDPLASGGTPYGTMIVMPGNVAAPPPMTYGSLGTFQGQRVDGTQISMTVTSSIAPTVPPTGYPPTGYPGGGYSNYPASGQVNATGYIQVSQFIQSLLVQTAMGGNSGFGTIGTSAYPGAYPGGYPPGYAAPGVATTQICVSNVAISLQRTISSYANILYQGSIYFYLSGGMTNGQHGLALDF